MQVSNYSGLGTGTASGSLTGNSPTMGKEDFLKLLVAQLAHQDPMQPVDNTEFVSQLSQFSGLEQLMNANENLGMVQLQLASQANAQVSSLIGKEVEARGDVLRHQQQGPAGLRFDLASAAKATTVTIRDANDRIVRTLEVSERMAGANTVAWDGKDAAGNMAQPGNYKIEVAAKDADGADVRASLKITGRVTGVSFSEGVPLLEVGDTTIQVADVLAVRQQASSQGGTNGGI